MRKKNIIILSTIVAVLACAIYVLLVGFPGGTSAGEPPVAEASPAGAAGQDGPIGQDSGETASWEPGADVESLWYYDQSLMERYGSFAERMPGLPPDDVVWMVDAGLDAPPYTETAEAEDTDSDTLLVNKHFCLPQGFSPSDLVTLGDTMLRKEAETAMEKMIRSAAEEEGHVLWVQSGFRSYEVQASLYDQYSERDGDEYADTYCARPGFSEHQSGLAADLNTVTDAFGETAEGRWVFENCWQYGFIMRYTKENADITQYRPEPWHVRYIGEDAAAEANELGFLSYEEYWVKYIKHTPPSAG